MEGQKGTSLKFPGFCTRAGSSFTAHLEPKEVRKKKTGIQKNLPLAVPQVPTPLPHRHRTQHINFKLQRLLIEFSFWCSTRFISSSVLSSHVELHSMGWEWLPLNFFLNWDTGEHCNYSNIISQKLTHFNTLLQPFINFLIKVCWWGTYKGSWNWEFSKPRQCVISTAAH